MERGRGRIWRAATRHTAVRGASLVAAAALVFAGCSSEDIAERAAEQAIERQLEAEGEGGDVDVDFDGDGGIQIETPEGAINIDADDGNISIQGEGSDGDVEMNFDEDAGQTVISTPEGEMVIGSGDLPEDFPGDVPVPDGLAIASATSMSSPDGKVFILNGSVDDEFGDATDSYASALVAAGFEQQSMTESTDGTFFAFGGDQWNVSGGIYPSSSGNGSDVGINVVPNTP